MNPSAGRKRDRDSENSPTDQSTVARSSDDGSSTTNFRNVSACNRCRTRKNKCDQKLPQCSGCEKANVKCVGFDPVSRRAIPRSYVYYLESRVRTLEHTLQDHSIQVPPPEENFAISDDIQPGRNVPFPVLDEDPHITGGAESSLHEEAQTLDPVLHQRDEHEKLNKLVSDVGMVSVQGTSESRYLGTTSGISFARVVFAAVRSSVTQTPSEKGGRRHSRAPPSEAAGGSGTSMRDSFFGLHTKPTIRPAPFPDKAVGEHLVNLYFEFANPQIPILHRVEFAALLDRVYATEPEKRTARELYLVNIAFAIGSGIIMDSSNHARKYAGSSPSDTDSPALKRQRMDRQQHQPEEYHSSAVVHLESFLGSSPAVEGGGGGLEELQAVLLLAGLALLRPVAPGLWYIVGVAVRLAVDLGLHSEDNQDLDQRLDTYVFDASSEASKGLGRKQWTRDLRRRLWWCVYAFDRLVSTCVGRPFGITDLVVTTEFPSMLEDRHITTNGFLVAPTQQEIPSYKLVARHYFRLRLLQSEILQVLQHRQAEKARSLGANQANEYINKNLLSPFLHRFESFRDWRLNVDRRLWQWKESAPKQADTGVAFNPAFLELNYYQAIIMLYRQSLAVPEQLAGEVSPSTGSDVHSPGAIEREAKEDEQMVFMKVAQAGQMVLKLYRQLHRLKLVNYTFLATHHLFMSGISFLYAIWHSPMVRAQLSLEDVDYTVLSATSVLEDLIEKCPPAEACRDAFVRMSKATIAMAERTTGFGSQSTLSSRPLNDPETYFGNATAGSQQTAQPASRPQKRKLTMPKFDMNLKDLFEEDEITSRPLKHQPKLHGFSQRLKQPQEAPSANYAMPPVTALPFNTVPQLGPTQTFASTSPSQSLHLSLSNQQPYAPFAETISQTQPDFSFDDMGFLDTFPVSDPNPGSWGGWSTGGMNELDLGFGTGGTGSYDADGNWDPNGSIDMFNGFFFGGNESSSAF